MTENKEQEAATDISQILESFLKIGKNGPYEIMDDCIAQYLTHEKYKMMVLNGRPYLYRNGYYAMDRDGKNVKLRIKQCIPPELITAPRVNRVYNLILMDYELSKTNDEVNQYPKHWVNFKNGMYDPITQTMYPHKPEYFSINQIPYEYREDVTYTGSTVERFLKGIFPDDQDREMFLAYSGYCMTRDTHLQKFLVLQGVPGSGKSTAINLLIEAVGKDNISCITLQDLNERFTPTELLGKLLNACADLPKTALEQVDALKRITGEDQIKGEYKGGEVFRFSSYAKLIFSANEMPVSLDEKSDAFFRRILLIDVARKGEYIDGLKRKLKAEIPEFIKACMDALSKLYQEHREIDSPNSKRLVHEYHRETDSVQSFLDDRIERRPGEKMERTRLYEMYKDYCCENEWGALSARGFYKNLRGKGFRESIYHGYRHFKDICTRGAYNSNFREIDNNEKVPF